MSFLISSTLNASELNDAIDNTNFPKLKTNLTEIEENGTSDKNDETKQTNGTSVVKREHPAPLKIVSFNEEVLDVIGTPRTPRTSTTPGLKFYCFCDSLWRGYLICGKICHFVESSKFIGEYVFWPIYVLYVKIVKDEILLCDLSVIYLLICIILNIS